MVDLLVLWAWELDLDFVTRLQQACNERQVSTYFAGEHDMARLPALLESGELKARCAIDRVWDWGGEWERHVPAMKAHVPCMLNPYDDVRLIWNKPHVHFLVIQNGLHAPYMAVVPSVWAEANPRPVDLAKLGGPFSIKSAHSGGSGVIRPATTWSEVLEKRQEWPGDETLVQTWVEPRTLVFGQIQRRAWFRVFYACGSTFLCWQDDRTHRQQMVTPEEESQFGLDVLRGMVHQISNVCGLQLFSTEIALDQNGIWQVVDYVNDPCDYRLQSTAHEGVPDEVVTAVCERIAGWVKRQGKSD